MAIESKAVFLHDIEQHLSTILTAADMHKTLTAISDVCASFSMERTAALPEDGDDLLDAFLDALEVEGRSPKTLVRYRYIITKMCKALAVPTRQITVYHIRRYLMDEKARGIADRTLEGIREVLSSYFNWLQRENLIETNPTSNLGVIKYAKKQKDLYSDSDIERLKLSCHSIRDRAIVCFLKSTGCRISEMCGLNVGDINLERLECKVIGKGNKERVVFLDEVTAMTLREYLDSRTDSFPALFIGRGTDRLHPNGIRKMLSALGRQAHVTHVHPHKFRRTTATNLIRHGMPIQEVAMILGHDKLDTTMQYVVLDNSDVKNAYRKYT